MRKLTLESLTVESFETAPTPEGRGTVAAHQIKPVPPSFLRPCYPTDPNFDCTLGCTNPANCLENTADCVPLA